MKARLGDLRLYKKDALHDLSLGLPRSLVVVPSMLLRVLRQIQYAVMRRLSRALPVEWLSPYWRFVRSGGNTLLVPESCSQSDSGIIIEMGGYLGEGVSTYLKATAMTIVSYEPIPEFASQLEEMFETNPRVDIRPYGLNASGESQTLYLNGDRTGSSAEGQPRLCQFVSVSDEVSLWPERIDLLVINIEGAEYELLSLLEQSQVLSRISVLLVQFHCQQSNHLEQLHDMRQLLRKTHSCQWHYDFVWERWDLREIPGQTRGI